MKTLLIPLAAFGALAGATAALAQDWDRGRDWDRGGWRHEDEWRGGGRQRHWDDHSTGGCRWITIRSEDDWGNVRVRRVRRCD